MDDADDSDDDDNEDDNNADDNNDNDWNQNNDFKSTRHQQNADQLFVQSRVSCPTPISTNHPWYIHHHDRV